ncbi:MAG TPA: hypothetical protein VEY12_04115 [Thermoplasmata archaeon]|nr:hypothetical protein [Thermoplasmata archaeon]
MPDPMGLFPPRARFEAAVAAGNGLLARHRFPQRGSARELEAWLQTDTPYPNPEPAAILASPFLVVHEIVEIEETKRAGLTITKDVILRHTEAINDAHLAAAEVELRIAAMEREREYVASRFDDLQSWCEDPVLTPGQRAAYESLRDRVATWLRVPQTDRATEGI